MKKGHNSLKSSIFILLRTLNSLTISQHSKSGIRKVLMPLYYFKRNFYCRVDQPIAQAGFAILFPAPVASDFSV